MKTKRKMKDEKIDIRIEDGEYVEICAKIKALKDVIQKGIEELKELTERREDLERQVPRMYVD